MTNGRRVASILAVTICSLYSLDVDDFKEILNEYPVMRRAMEKVAAARLSSLGKQMNCKWSNKGVIARGLPTACVSDSLTCFRKPRPKRKYMNEKFSAHGEKGENEYEKESENLAQMTIAHDQIPPSDIDTRTDNDIIKNDSHRISIHKRIQR